MPLKFEGLTMHCRYVIMKYDFMVLHGCVPQGPNTTLYRLFHIWLTLSKPLKSITVTTVSVRKTDHEECI